MSDPAAPDPSDDELLSAFLAGDRTAFDVLVRRHSRRVYGVCHRYFRDQVEAEDAAQETFLTVLRRAETFAGAASFSTWLYRVTINTCNDIARRRSRRPRGAPLDEDKMDHPDVGVEAALEGRELAADLRAALAALDPAQREAVVLHDVLGYPYADIAARTGTAVGTVKSRIHRGHARLAALMRAADGEPSEPLRPPTVQP